MDLVTFGLIALGLVIVFVVATHKKKEEAPVAAPVEEVPTLVEIAAKAEVVSEKPAKAKKAPVKKAVAKAPAKKAPAKKAPAKKPAAGKAKKASK